MNIKIIESMKNAQLRYTTWEGKKNEYWAQDCVVQLNDIETTVWEVRVASPEEAYPVGDYQICLTSFQTKKFPNTGGQLHDFGCQRPEVKTLKLRPVQTLKKS